MSFLDRFTSNKGKAAKQAPGVGVVKKADEKEVIKKKETAKKAAKGWDARRSIILRPLVTEKSASLATDGTYTFAVDARAGRIEVREAIRALYGITPARVNMVNVRGKAVRTGAVIGARKDWKKAFVTLPHGKTIDVYEGV